MSSGRVGRLGIVGALVAASVVAGVTGTAPGGLVESPPAQAAGAQLIFERGGTPPVFGANDLVEIFTGTINFIGGNQRTAAGQFSDVCKLKPLPDGSYSGVPRLTPGFDDFFQPFADIYIVPAGRPPTNNQRLVDVAGAPNTVVGGLAGGIFFEGLAITAPRGRLGGGNYAIVVDECQNGVWDTWEDTYIDNAFRVELQQDVPPLSIAARQFVALKERANQVQRSGGYMYQLQQEWKIIQTGFQAFSRIAATPSSVEGLVTNMLIAGINAVAAQSNPYTQLKKRGEAVRDTVMAQIATRWRRLAADPPQSNYQRFAVPIVAGASFDDGRAELNEAVALYFAAIDAMSGLSQALLDAIERYQGADLAGDALWAARHARSIEEIVALAPVIDTALEQARARLDAALDGLDLNDLLGPANRLFADLDGGALEDTAAAANFLPELDILEFTVSVWNELFDRNGGSFTLDTSSEWRTAIADATAEFRSYLDTFAGLGVLAGDLLVGLAPELAGSDPDPSMSISSAAPIRAGDAVALTATDAPAGSTVTWDLDGDGEFDDGTGATVTWNVPGDVLVGSVLMVAAQARQVSDTDPSDSALAAFVVESGGNRPPEIPIDAATYREVAPGGTVTLTVAATDPDGDPLTYEWFVQGQPTGQTGTSFDYTAPAGRLSSHIVDVWVSDGSAETRVTFVVQTPVTDEDNDGWYATPGPDCGDVVSVPGTPNRPGRNVNPGQPEFGGNTIDDDCDGEVDEPTPPLNVRDLVVRIYDRDAGTQNTSTEGDVMVVTPTWDHPFENVDGEQFELVADWGDGTVTSTVDVRGSGGPYAFLTHAYEEEGDHVVELCMTWLTDPTDPNDSDCHTTVIRTINDAPLVNAADLRDWGPTQDGPLARAQPGMFWPIDDDGHTVFTRSNFNPRSAYPAPAGLPGPGGYGRFSVLFDIQQGGDNDLVGMLFGYDPTFDLNPVDADGPEGEWFDPAGEFIGVQWRDWRDWTNIRLTDFCNDAPAGLTPSGTSGITVWRQNGVPSQAEMNYVQNFDVPYDASDDATADGGVVQDPVCSDGQGLTPLGGTPRDNAPGVVGKEVWQRRVVSDPGPGRTLDPYLFTVDYQPDEIVVFIDGEEQVRIPNPGPDPFPPGGVALLANSQHHIRMSATDATPVFTFDEGAGGEFDPTTPPGTITVPMHDGAADDHEARVSWGDDSATTEGTVAPDPATGGGWFTITDEHVYEDDGTFTGEVCATDDEGLGTCHPFIAEVRNRPPVVRAGPDRASGALARIDDATFQDPAALDTHTATIDWGDGSGAQPATVDGARGGGVVTGTHVYAASGDYTVEVCVTDDDGATGCDSTELEVVVEPAAPRVGAVEDGASNEGEVVPLGVGFSDSNVDDVHTIDVDFGDGTSRSGLVPDQTATACSAVDVGGTPTPECALSAMAAFEHEYEDDGTFTVTVEVCDDGGECASATGTVDVSNVAPTLGVDDPSVDGAGVQLAGTFDDPGDDDVEISVDWGDGVTDTGAGRSALIGRSALVDAAAGTFTASHTYAASGTYDVDVCADDGDGGRTCASQRITVTAAAASTTPSSSTPGSSAPGSTTSDTTPGSTTPPTNPPGSGGGGTPVTPPPPTTMPPIQPTGALPATGGGGGAPALVTIALLLFVVGATLLIVRRRRHEPTVHRIRL